MELNERLKNEIARVFGGVEYGRVTFHLSPEKKTLDYTVETTGKIPAESGPARAGMKGPSVTAVKPPAHPFQEYLIARGLLYPDGTRVTRGLGPAAAGLAAYMREGGDCGGMEKLTWRTVQELFRKEDGRAFSPSACRKARELIFAP